MKIMVSACLLGQNCKYNGGNNYNERVAEYIKGHEVIPVCPEIAGGLPTPRIPCEIVNGVVTNKNGKSKDKEFRVGNSITATIPNSIIKQTGIKPGDKLDIFVDGSSIVMVPEKKRLRGEIFLEEYYGKPVGNIQELNTENVDWGEPEGAEEW